MEENEYQKMFAVEGTHWWFVGRRMFLSKLFARVGIVPGRQVRIADIGAGTGGMSTFLSRYGSLVGIEPHKPGRALAKSRGMRMVAATAEKTTLKTASVDIVCFFDVLYHKNIHQNKALAEGYRILKPGGFLIITDCAFPWLTSAHDLAVHGMRRYTTHTLANSVSRAGFDVLLTSYMFFVLFPVFVARRLIWRGVGSDVHPMPTSFNHLLIWICFWEAQFLSFFTFPWGSSVVLVAKKDMA